MRRTAVISLALLVVATTSAISPKRSATTANASRAAEVASLLAQPDSLRPRYLYTDAVKALSIECDTAKAVRLSLEAIRLQHDYAPAYNLLGRTGINDTILNINALQAAERAVELDSLCFAYRETAAETALRMQRYDRATAHLEKIVATSHEGEHFRLLALLYMFSNRQCDAIAVIDSSEVRIGRNPLLARIRQSLYITTGNLARAEQEGERLIADMPYLAESHIAMADVYEATRRDSLALAEYKRAIELEPDNVETWRTLGNYYQRHRDMNSYLGVLARLYDIDNMPVSMKIEQLRSFMADRRFYRDYYPRLSALVNRLAIRYPADRSAQELLADHHIASGKVADAAEVYERILDSTRIADYMRLIEIELYLDNTDKAQGYLRRGLERFPRSAELHAQHGHIHAILGGNQKKAIKSYETAIRYATNDSIRSQLWGFIGDAYQRGEKPDMRHCYAAYERALKLDKDNVAVLNNYAYFLSLEGRDLDRALDMATRAVAQTSNNATYLDTLAWVYYRLGRYAEAKRTQQQAISFDRNSSAEMALHYGDILEALGEHSLARTYWRKALERGADKGEIEERIDKQIVKP